MNARAPKNRDAGKHDRSRLMAIVFHRCDCEAVLQGKHLTIPSKRFRQVERQGKPLNDDLPPSRMMVDDGRNYVRRLAPIPEGRAIRIDFVMVQVEPRTVVRTLDKPNRIGGIWLNCVGSETNTFTRSSCPTKV